MKVIVSILLLISLLETFMPCFIWDDCPHENVASSKTNNSEKSCSPFSYCSVCLAVYIMSEELTLSVVGPASASYITLPDCLLSSLYCSSFWQPPKAYA